MTSPEIAKRTSLTLSTLSMDAVEKANSGHPGMPMGASDMAYVLWQHKLRFHPQSPTWPNRDRFVLSAGHGSMLLYSLLHLYGFDLGLNDLQNFRQLHSKTPGHPEFGHTPGVEATTGPLGQGFANGVGMAIAESMLRQKFRDEHGPLIDHYVYAICGDGDLMEGISSEAASLAGHLGLGKLIYLYDDNHISIDGNTDITFTEDVEKKFVAMGWQVLRADGHNMDEVLAAIESAQQESTKPSLIMARTHIGKGSPNKQDSSSSHGAPLGTDEIAATKAALGWSETSPFHVPEEVKNHCKARLEDNQMQLKHWQQRFDKWKQQASNESAWNAFFTAPNADGVFSALQNDLPSMPDATRSISGKQLQTIAGLVPSLISGSADLAGSTKAIIKDTSYVQKGQFAGRNIHFGVREHAMGAIANGMCYYGGFIPVTSTFLVFSDYLRPAIRVAALSKLQNIFVFTHDSVFLGEDGPTHQPIEHIASLRLIPNVQVLRPGNAFECALAWKMALAKTDGPSAICLSRQKLPETTPNFDEAYKDADKGMYTFLRSEKEPDINLIASGSELSLAIAAKALLEKKGIQCQVSSAPCLESFAQQGQSYQDSALPSNVKNVVIEAGRTDLWPKFVGRDAMLIGVDTFGASAPGEQVAQHFGLTPEKVCEKVSTWCQSFELA